MIARTVHSLLDAGCSPAHSHGADKGAAFETQIFGVAHNCSDATALVAENAGARALQLNNRRLRGKGAALRFGFQAALESGANAFLVIDADSVVSPNLIAVTRAALAEGADATQCRYELESPGAGSVRPLARLRVLAFRGVNVLRARGRAGLGFSAGLFGNGFALTAETLDRVPFSADSICEDIEYHIKLVSAGIRVEWVEDASVYAPLSAPGAAQASQEARWEGGRLHVASRQSGRLLAAMFKGNWRAIEMLAEAWSLPLSRGILTLLLTALLPQHWLHVFALCCAGIAVLYVIEAAMLGAEPGKDLAALAVAPLHMLWKMAITPLVLRQTRKRAEWARTKREAQ
jgi:cellulose synthase/poly-beta-1,6-N-acetylglucosamine synthase-like glycosyltransferase